MAVPTSYARANVTARTASSGSSARPKRDGAGGAPETAHHPVGFDATAAATEASRGERRRRRRRRGTRETTQDASVRRHNLFEEFALE